MGLGIQRHFALLDDENSAQSYLNRLMVTNTAFKGADHILTKVSNLTRAAVHATNRYFGGWWYRDVWMDA